MTEQFPNADTGDELVFLPLGGSGEIGMNLNLYGYGPPDDRWWVMIDCGITFGDERLPGVDVILPDPSFIEERKDRLLGIVLTHAHEDHLGAVHYLWPRLDCPVYATPFTANVLKEKLAEAQLLDEVPLHVIPLGSRFTLGPFDLELVTLTHSIPEPNAVAVRTALGTVMHTGDWKIDPDPMLGDDIDETRLRAIGDETVRAIVCDSTNVFSPGVSGSEAEVAKNLVEVIDGCEGRVAVTTFASNVARVASIAKAAVACDRQPVLAGRAMHKLVRAAQDAGYLKDFPSIVSEEDASYLPREKALIICTGSQGEPRAALARMVADSHPNISLDAGDTVIFSSRIIPGNEIGIFEMQNKLAERGIRVITEKDHFVHVSGHPCRDELQAMYRWIRPELAIPVHGETRHLAEHADLARTLQVAEAIPGCNGEMIRIAPGRAQVVDEVVYGRLYRDGDVILPAGDVSVTERRRLSFAGVVFVSLAIDSSGAVRGDIDIRLMGVPEEDEEGNSFEDLVFDAIDEVLDRIPRAKRGSPEALAEQLRRSVRGALRRTWGKKPQVEVVVTLV